MRELLDVARLVLEIELEQHRLAEFRHDAGRRVDAGLLDDAFEEARQVEEQIGIGSDLLLDRGALHLHDHGFAVGQPRAMDLRDGSRRHRLGIDVGEQLARGPSQALLDQPQHRFHRHRRRAILQVRQLGDEVRRQDVRARRQDLPQLDERGTELGERLAKAAGARGAHLGRRGTIAGLAPAEHVPEAAAVEQLAESVPHDDHADLAEALQVFYRLDHPAETTKAFDRAALLERRGQRALKKSIFTRNVSACVAASLVKAPSSPPRFRPPGCGVKSAVVWWAYTR